MRRGCWIGIILAMGGFGTSSVAQEVARSPLGLEHSPLFKNAPHSTVIVPLCLLPAMDR
jgi:hypothetical protein